MRTIFVTALLAVVAFSTVPASAQSVTATCKDGSSFSGTSRRGACRGHGGVQAFGAAQPLAPAAPAPAASQAGANAPSRGAPGQVWVNTASKVYHCPGDRYYGKTKRGAYMTESAARSAGDRPDHGKACS